MNYIAVDIADFRNNLADYLALVNLGETVISVKNGKSGKEIAKITGSVTPDEEIEKRVKELEKLAGFAAGTSLDLRRKFDRMEKEYIEKLKKGIIE